MWWSASARTRSPPCSPEPGQQACAGRRLSPSPVFLCHSATRAGFSPLASESRVSGPEGLAPPRSSGPSRLPGRSLRTAGVRAKGNARMDRRRLLLILAVFVAVIGTALVFLYVKGADKRANNQYANVTVLKATANIAPGETYDSALSAGK